MQILSKDETVENSLKKMRKIIEDFGYKIKLSKEKNPIKNAFSVNLSLEGANNYIFSNGKGALLNSCLASAYGEFIERLQTNLYFNDYYLDNRKFFKDQKEFDLNDYFLSDELKNYYNFEDIQAEDFLDFNSNSFDKIISLPFINQTTKDIEYFPINLLINLYASNGLSTGNSPNEAKVQALSEIFERYVKLKVIKEGLALPEFPKDIINSFPNLALGIKELEDYGYKIKVYDASLGGVFPVTAIAFINPKNNTLFLSFGSHNILEVSLERTFTELLQGREIDELDDFSKPSFDEEDFASSSNLESHFIDSNAKVGMQFLSLKKSFSYTPWKFHKDSSQEQFAFLKEILDNENKTMYIREYNYLGFYSCQIIVPDFSEIYPFEDMIYNNKNQGKLIRNFILNRDDYDLNELFDELNGFDDLVNVGAFIGVLFKKPFILAEFKADILIKLEEFDEAIFHLELSKNPFSYLLAQILRAYTSDLDLEDYKEALNLLFDEDDVKRAFDIIFKKEFLVSLEYSDEYKNILALFDSKKDRR